MENTNTTKQLSNNISLEDIITTSIKIPGVKVNRDKFLAEQFAGTGANVQDIINLGPIDAGISREDISNTANKLIIKRTGQSSVASFVAGMPGGLAMAATIPADVMQFFGMALRLAQELAYLYGGGDLWVDGQIDDEKVKSQLIMYCGVMFGVSGAVSGVRVLSTQIAKTTLKKLPQKALTKTFWYPIIKQIGKAIGVKVTKTTVAQSASKAIPIIGGVISGGLNFASMMPMAKRLSEALDKATFDYSEDEYENDLNIIDKISNGEIVVEPESETKEEIKQKVSNTIDDVKKGVSGIVGKFGKKISHASDAPSKDPIEEVKLLKELLDIGAITQEEFDTKKKELLNL